MDYTSCDHYAQGLPVYRSGWFFAFVILDLCSGWIFCRLVQHGLRNASRTAPPLADPLPVREAMENFDARRLRSNGCLTAAGPTLLAAFVACDGGVPGVGPNGSEPFRRGDGPNRRSPSRCRGDNQERRHRCNAHDRNRRRGALSGVRPASGALRDSSGKTRVRR